MDKTLLPEELAIRSATLADIETIHGLIQAHEVALYGEPMQRLDDTRRNWTGRNVNLAEDSRLAFDRMGRLVGCLRLEHSLRVRFYVTVRVLPDYSDERLGDYLHELAEIWARERVVQCEPGMRVTLNAGLSARDAAGQRRYARAGLQEVRRSWDMEIELSGTLPAPAWPEGIRLRPFVPERDERPVFEMINAAFQDHWGNIPLSFAEWRGWMIERANFDPSLWFIACEGDQIVGSSLCYDEEVHGWVDDLGVLRPWRGRGLGMALLQHSFGEFYRRGQRKVGLSVDSQNLTGALRIYQRAGMHMVREQISYEKELRAGVDLSTRVLAH